MALDDTRIYLNKANFDIGLSIYYNGNNETINDEIDQYFKF